MPKNKIEKEFQKGKKVLDTERTLLQKTEGQAYALLLNFQLKRV